MVRTAAAILQTPPTLSRARSWRARLGRMLRVLARIMFTFRPFWPWVLGMVIATLVAISAELVEPLLQQVFINRVLLGREAQLLPDVLLLYLAAAMGNWLSANVLHYCFLQAAERYSVHLRVEAYRHLRRLSLRGLRKQSSGEVVAALQQFGPEVGDGFLSILQSVTGIAYRLPTSIILMMHLSGPLAVWTTPALCLYPFYPLLTVRPLRRALASLTLFDVQSQGVVNDNVVGLSAMLHRRNEEPDANRLWTLLWRRIRLRTRVFFVDRAGGLLDVVAHQGMTVLLLGIGGLRVLHGQMTVGGLLAFFEYVRGVEGPVRRLMHLPIGLQRVAVMAERVFHIMDQPEDVPPPRRGRKVGPVPCGFELRGVTVRGDDGQDLLRRVNLRIPPGSVCALVGPSGAGKSTLAALLPRLLDPVEGQVLLNGEDLRTYDLAALRLAVAYVPQEPVFFRESLFDNVRVGRPGASDAEVLEALGKAQATDFVRMEGDSGSRVLFEAAGNLSGGQRQRLALARAYLQDAPALILDEPTSALDPRLRRRVLTACLRDRGRRTIVLVSHHPEEARMADVVVLLSDGAVRAVGPPERVLSGGGLGGSPAPSPLTPR